MEEKLNIAEILKDKPQGTKLYDLLRNIYVELYRVHLTVAGDYIECISTNEVGSTLMFDYSKLGIEKCWLDGLQILLPSKEMRDWSKLAWNTGDILVSKDGNAHVIFEGFDDDTYETFNGNNYLWKNEGITMCFGEYEDELPTSDFSKANKEDAQRYIHKIEKRLGGKLNIETLEIEKQTEFKDGDILSNPSTALPKNHIFIFSKFDKHKDFEHHVALTASGVITIPTSHGIWCRKDSGVKYATEEEKKQLFSALEKEGKAWDAEKKAIVDLKPKYEFKPMDLCLMKYIGQYNNRGWELCQYAYTEHRVSSIGEQRDFYHAVGGEIYAECIPYKGNEHLLGTTKDVEG